MARSLTDRIRFLTHFFLKPQTLGALTPSAPGLVEALLAHTGIEDADALAELGPGTGAATVEILARKQPQVPFFVVEKDERWVRLLRRRHPNLDVQHGNAADLHTFVQARSLPPLDAVISSLPFTFFNEALQVAILNAVVASLRSGGAFATFAYMHGKDLPAGRQFRDLLTARFERVEISEPVWRNTPPAVVYRAWSA